MAEVVWMQSSHCSGGNCVQVAHTRATTCGGGTCVEVAQDGNAVLIRDSKSPAPSLRFTVAEFRAFVRGVKDGEFDW